MARTAISWICGLWAITLIFSCTPARDIPPTKDPYTTCRNVAIDAHKWPEEYLPGSGNHQRIQDLGVRPENIGTIGPAHSDCKSKYGVE